MSSLTLESSSQCHHCLDHRHLWEDAGWGRSFERSGPAPLQSVGSPDGPGWEWGGTPAHGSAPENTHIYSILEHTTMVKCYGSLLVGFEIFNHFYATQYYAYMTNPELTKQQYNNTVMSKHLNIWGTCNRSTTRGRSLSFCTILLWDAQMGPYWVQRVLMRRGMWTIAPIETGACSAFTSQSCLGDCEHV